MGPLFLPRIVTKGNYINRCRDSIARFDQRTKTEHRATILLPNPVAAYDRRRHVMDGRAKIFKENKTAQNGPSPAEMAITEFRVRCFQSRTYREARASKWVAGSTGTSLAAPASGVCCGALSAGTSSAPPPYRYFNLRERPSNRRRHAERELTVQPVAKSAHAFMSSLRALTRVDRWYARSTASPTAWDNAISASSLG